MVYTFGRALLNDVRMTITDRVHFAQYSASDMAMGGYLENAKNRTSEYDTSLNTIFDYNFLSGLCFMSILEIFSGSLLQILVQSPGLNTYIFLHQQRHLAACSTDLLIFSSNKHALLFGLD